MSSHIEGIVICLVLSALVAAHLGYTEGGILLAAAYGIVALALGIACILTLGYTMLFLFVMLGGEAEVVTDDGSRTVSRDDWFARFRLEGP